MNPKIIFIGTPDFSAIILKTLCESEYKPILVVTASDKPVGRKQIITPPPVKVLAEKYGIEICQPEKIEKRASSYRSEDGEEGKVLFDYCKLKIENCKPDLIIVAAYGQILPKEILEIPKNGCFNIHPSLLPKYRGSTPIQAAILNGDKKTGVTIILMDEKMDHGPIVNQRALEIEENETATALHDKLAEFGASLLLETIPKWQKGILKTHPQDETKVTYTKILTREDGRINWKKTAKELEKEVRAYTLWPESFTFWERKGGRIFRIKILKTRVLKSTGGINYPIGKTLVVPQNEIGVQCGGGLLPGRGGGFLVIERLKMEGGGEMGSEEFLRGHPEFIGTILK